jgi:hypothetical protein
MAATVIGQDLVPSLNGWLQVVMSRLDKLHAAKFDERDIAARQLNLQLRAVMRGAEQHRLPA